MASTVYSLEHFYYGQVLIQGKPQGELRMLATSAGIKADHFAELVSAVRLPPAAGHPTLAWALGRGKNTPFVLVQSQVGAQGGVICHYYVPPVEALRQLSGNLSALLSLVEPAMPSFERTDATLPLVQLRGVEPPGLVAQQDSMLELLGAASDRFEIVEALLAAVIVGVPVMIKGAPADLNQRIGMVQGLLTLLPHPARYSVTFSTHATPASTSGMQIRFVTDDTPTTPDMLVYTWGAREIQGKRVENEYARYIRSQLRLDTELVVKQTTALTPVAGWRLRRGESLSDALKYASYRLTIDNAVSDGLPIEAQDVARVLGEDPTLTDEQKIAYIRHLMAFIMATDEVENADLMVVAVGKPVLEPVIMEQLGELMNTGKALRVYRALTRWLAHPAGLRGMYWIDLAQKAALAYAQSLVRSRDSKAMNLFLAQVREATQLIEAKFIVSRLLEIALPLAASDPVLAQTTVVLAATALPLDQWQRFIALKPILNQLPRTVVRLVAYLNAEQNAALSPGLLAQAAGEFGAAWRSLILIRMAEIALAMGRLQVFDSPSLLALAQAAGTAAGEMYDSVLRRVVYHFSDDASLRELQDDAPRALLQILLSRQSYADLANELVRHGRVLFPSGKQLEYAQMVRNLFASTTILPGNVQDCMNALTAEGTKPLPLVMAYFGALQQHQWSPSLKDVTAELISLLNNHRLIVEGLPIDLLMELLRACSDMRDMPNTIRAALLMPMNAARRGEDGIVQMFTLYRSLTWEPNTEGAAEVKKAALENLRRFIRKSSDSAARTMINNVPRIDESLLEPLKATYVIRRMLGGENLADYAYALATTANFLQDTGSAYADKTRMPLLATITGDLDSMIGGVNDDERGQIADGMLDLIKLTSGLAQQHRNAHPRETDADIQALLDGAGEAQSVIDIFRVMSGYLGRGRRITPRMERLTESHPLGDRTAPALLREVQTMSHILKNALLTFPYSGKISVRASEIIAEIESLWGDITLHERRELVNDLASDLQRIPDMMLSITNRIDAKALIDQNNLTRKLDSNKQRPENTLELYRFVYAYFRNRIR
ncbi:MAG: hypothetical protein SF162_10855 [bacterium]|nr:hypothetical protein [bacterium]